MARLPRPDVGPGPHADLVNALHELHHRSGWPSLRRLAVDAACSHTTVWKAFSSATLPAWGTVELRFLLSSTSSAALFFDGGYYRRQADQLHNVGELDEWIYGYGAGIQVETPLGLARVSYALGKPDNFATGKIFIGLVNQF